MKINEKVSKKRQSFNYGTLATENEVEIAPFWVYEYCVSDVWVCTSCKTKQRTKETYFVLFLMKISKYLTLIFLKKNLKQSQHKFFVFKIKINKFR